MVCGGVGVGDWVSYQHASPHLQDFLEYNKNPQKYHVTIGGWNDGWTINQSINQPAAVAAATAAAAAVKSALRTISTCVHTVV